MSKSLLSKDLQREIISAQSDPDAQLFDLVPFEDRLLRDSNGLLGHSVDEYDWLLRDLHIGAAFQNRWKGVIQAEIEVIPGGDDERDIKAADRVKDQLFNSVKFNGDRQLDKVLPDSKQSSAPAFDKTCLAWLEAILKGYKPCELFWERGDGEVRLSEIRPRPSRRILFEYVNERTPRNAQLHEGHAIKLLTRSNPMLGEFVTTPRKLLIHSWGSKESNPYGYGLGSALWWPGKIKRDNWKLWLIAAGRAAAFLRGQLPQNVGKESEAYKLLESLLKKLAPEGYLLLPDGITVDLMESGRTDPAIHDHIRQALNSEISEFILGQTGTINQDGSSGSRARDEVADENELELAKMDSDLLSPTCNTLARWITELNDPEAKPPTIWRQLEKGEELGQRADRESKLVVSVGKPLDQTYVEETYGVKFADVPLLPPTSEGTKGSEHAAPHEFGGATRFIYWQGFKIGIEVEVGQERFGKPMRIAYGYFVNHVGADKEALDVYIGPHLSSDLVFRVTQVRWDDPTRFDEHKYMICFASMEGAERAYKKQMTSRPFGGIEAVDIDEIRQHAKSRPMDFAAPPDWQLERDMAERRRRWALLKDAPYVRWVHGNDTTDRPRPEHVALDGQIFPNNRLFWSFAMPPNAYFCQCYLEPVWELPAGAEVAELPRLEDVAEYLRYSPLSRSWYELPVE